MSGARFRLVKRFMDFYYSPWGAAKGEIWESFSNDRPFSDDSAAAICHLILQGHSFDWTGISETTQ